MKPARTISLRGTQGRNTKAALIPALKGGDCERRSIKEIKMARYRLIIFFLLCFFIATAPTSSFSQKTPEYTDPRQPIEVKPGQEFVISIESNPTTGYAWELAEPLDKNILELLKTEYILGETRIGAGGKEEWIFKAQGKGRTNIHLKYVRSWEKDKPAVREAVFVVVAGEKIKEQDKYTYIILRH